MNYRVYINSAGRFSTRLHTIENLPRSIPITLAVPWNQRKEYKRFVCDRVDLLPLPKELPCYLPVQRHYVLSTCKEKCCILADDDLSFVMRGKPEEGGKHPIIEPSFKQLKAGIETLAATVLDEEKNMAVAGFAWKACERFVEEEFKSPDKVARFYAVNTESYRNSLCDISGFPGFVLEDVDLCLWMLVHGYRTCKYYTFLHMDMKGDNAKGGCSTYRTPKSQKDSVLYLMRKYPGLVKIKVVGSSNWKNWNSADRCIPRVQWTKAMKIGQRRSLTKDGVLRWLK